MRVAVIGAAGKVGSAIAFSLVGKVDELVLVDVVKDKLLGEYLDLSHSADGSTKISFYETAGQAKDCDVVIIPAGFPRTPEMKSRMELVEKNAPIVKGIVKDVSNSSPDCRMIIISNPMDVMTYLAHKVSGFEPSRIMGMGCTLDSRRLRFILSGMIKGKVDAISIGEHGPYMIPLLSQAKVNGKPLEKSFIEKNREIILQKVANTSSEVIQNKGGTWWGPALATWDIVQGLLKGPVTVPVSILHENVCVGLPAVIGKDGIKKFEIPRMDSWENSRFRECVKYMEQPCRWVDQWLKQ